MQSIVVPLVLAQQRSIPTQDNELWAYAMTGVVLFVIGCMLTILANARRAAADRPARPQSSPRVGAGRTSASVTRLQHDVRGWLKRTS